MPTNKWTLESFDATQQTWDMPGRQPWQITPGGDPSHPADRIKIGTCTGGLTQDKVDWAWSNFEESHQSIRLFNAGFPSSFSTSGMQLVRSYMTRIEHVVWSCKPGVNASTAAGSADATFTSLVNSIPEVENRTWFLAVHHEPENDVPLSDTTYHQQYRDLNNRFADIVHATGRSDIKMATIWMGCTMNGSCPGRDPDWWYADQVDVIGMDAYYPSQVPPTRAYAASKGKPWMVSEMAYHSYLSNTDAAHVEKLKEHMTAWGDPTIDDPPLNVQYFHATVGGTYPLFDTQTVFNGITIPARPLSRQYWTDLQNGDWRLHHPELL